MKKRNKERKKKEREENEKRILQKFPLGISTESNSEAFINYVHLEISFKKEKKDIEIYDIRCPKKEGFKFINYPLKKNSFFVVFPFYKTEEQNKISFGIRNSETSEEIDNNILVKGGNLNLIPIIGRGFELILKQSELFNYLKIYNLELEEKYHIEYLKNIQDMNIKEFNYSISGVRKIFENSNNYEIIDTIIQIGENNLSNILIEILNDKKMNLYKICDYLVKNKEKFIIFQNYYKTRNYIICRLYNKYILKYLRWSILFQGDYVASFMLV